MTWQEDATNAVLARIPMASPWWAWGQRGLWATARVSYGPEPLGAAFEEREVVLCGACRRVATADGDGRPLLILPGLYATLDEGLFARLARLAARSGRPVMLLEDRLAAGTLRANGGEIASLVRQADEVAAFAEGFSEPPDVLALSAGWAVAGRVRCARRVGWSPAADPEAVRGSVRGNPLLHAYYLRVHRRAFDRAGLVAPAIDTTWAALGSPPPPEPAPTLLFHARCDPVVPVSSVPEGTVLLGSGGHLGFGAVAGEDVYLLPLRLPPLRAS